MLGLGVLFGLCEPVLGQVQGTDRENPTTELQPLTVWGQAQTEDTDAYVAHKATVASKLPVAPREIPQSISVITRQRIEDQNLNTLEDALRQVTGITAIPNDSVQSQFRSRGYSLNLAIDGIPSVSGLSGAEQFDLAIYDRVEVLRGPSGLLSGSGDPGGTVNVVTKKPRNQFALNGTLSSGSWNNQRGELDITGPLNASGSLRGRLVGVGQDREFFYDRASQEKWVGYGVLEYDLTEHTTLSFTHAVQENDVDASYSGLPAFTNGELLDVSRSTNPVPDWSTSTSRTRETVLALEQRLSGDWTLTLKARRMLRDYDYTDTFAWTGVDPQTWTLDYANPRDFAYQYDSRTYDAYLAGPLNLFGRQHHFLLGHNYDRFLTHNTGGRGNGVIHGMDLFDPVIPEPQITHTSGRETLEKQQGSYAQARLSLLEPLTLVLGGRFSDYQWGSRSVAPATPSAWRNSETANNEFTPYGGILYDFARNWTLYLSYSDIFQPQSRQQADGSPLKPRVGKQHEVGIKASLLDHRLDAALAVFRIRDENRPMQDPQNPDFYIASGEVESRGWELEVSGSPLPGWNLSAGYSRLDTRYLRDDSQTGTFSTAEPRHSLKLWSHYRVASGPLAGLGLGGGISALSAYHVSRGSSTDRTQSGYTLLSAALSYPLNDHLTLALNGENLTDRKYYASLGGLNAYNIYGTPRNLTLSLRLDY